MHHAKLKGLAPTFPAMAGMLVVPKLHTELDDAPQADSGQAQGSYAGHDLLQIGL